MKLQTEWNLKKHLYASLRDPRIRRDIEKAKRMYRAFEKKWRHNDAYLKSESALLAILKDKEKILDTVGQAKPAHYLFFVKDLDAKNTDAVALSNKLSYELKQESTRMLFFTTKLAKIPVEQQKKFLKSAKLKKYRHLLKTTFEHGKHVLSEPEERISHFLSEPAAGMWEEGGERILSSMTIQFKGKELPLSKARELLKTLSRKDRRTLDALIVEKNKQHADYAENELNALGVYSRIQDDLRGYKTPYEATVSGNDNDPKVVETLVATTTKHYKIVHRFSEAKRKLLRLKKLQYVDRLESIGTVEKRVSFEQAAQMLVKTLEEMDSRYKKIFMDMLAGGQIDVYPKSGKRGGAYCMKMLQGPTFVLLNHVDSLRSYATLAHEMGHAIHSERIQEQPTIYQGYSTATAETASTFFEHVALERIESGSSENERLIMLHDRIDEAITTVFRQVACFNFEKEMHETIRKNGAVSKQDLARMMQKHLSAYLGPAYEVTEDDGYAYVSWPHIRSDFYVYTYAYGFLVSQALYRRYMQNPAFIEKIDKFLSAGDSDTVENIFKSIGIDLHAKTFWEDGLGMIEKDVKEFEKLVNKKLKK